jgi:hypothetical protein
MGASHQKQQASLSDLTGHGNPHEPPDKAWKFRLDTRFLPFAWRRNPALLEASAKQKPFLLRPTAALLEAPPMIPRYAREQMVSIWSPETKFRIWFEIEAHATDALAELGVVPKDAAAQTPIRETP